MTSSSSLTVGTKPFGFSARYSGSWLPPKGPPISTRSYSIPSSAQHQSTFCTLDEVVRPQIFSIPALRSPRPHGASVCLEAQHHGGSRALYDWDGGVDEAICHAARRGASA